MYAVLFDLHGNGSRWEVESVVTLETADAIIMDAVRNKRAQARHFLVIPAGPAVRAGKVLTAFKLKQLGVLDMKRASSR